MKRLGFMVGVLILAGCTENLATPGDCPELCPGQTLTVKDTTILANSGLDSAYFGYTPRAVPPALLVSSGLPAGEARTFVVFQPARFDSITVLDTLKELVIDTVNVEFTLLARDSTATGLKLYIHRVPVGLDSSATFAQLDPLLTPESLVDSIVVPDSVHTGLIQAQITNVTTIAKVLATVPNDSGRIGIAVRLSASKPTGVRLLATLSTGQPQIDILGKVAVTDTAKQRQKLTLVPEQTRTNFVLSREAAFDMDMLPVGGVDRARSLIRFTIPAVIKDSASLIKATLELTPVEPIYGLPADSAGSLLELQAITADLGGKSPVAQTVAAVEFRIPESAGSTISINIRSLVDQWRATNGPPPAVLIRFNPEGGSFMQPVFYSTRSLIGQPRLRIIYALPTHPGKP
ncbi:MAG: hypothetical protein ABI647_04815 [Gemmatimonadota bacterium]